MGCSCSKTPAIRIADISEEEALQHLFLHTFVDKKPTEQLIIGYKGKRDKTTGLKAGLGVERYANGNVYAGKWDKNLKHGKGKFTYFDGDEYEGEYSMDLRHGIGTYKYSDGKEYTGEFKFGKMDGKGVYKWPDGGIYDGEWMKDKRHGYGVMIANDCSRYEGEWISDEMTGLGVPCLKFIYDCVIICCTPSGCEKLGDKTFILYDSIVSSCYINQDKQRHFEDLDLFLNEFDDDLLLFTEAVQQWMQSLGNKDDESLISINEETLIVLYALYKQSVSGPFEELDREKESSSNDKLIIARRIAWKRLGNMDKNIAMRNFVKEVSFTYPAWRYDEIQTATAPPVIKPKKLASFRR